MCERRGSLDGPRSRGISRGFVPGLATRQLSPHPVGCRVSSPTGWVFAHSPKNPKPPSLARLSLPALVVNFLLKYRLTVGLKAGTSVLIYICQAGSAGVAASPQTQQGSPQLEALQGAIGSRGRARG